MTRPVARPLGTFRDASPGTSPHCVPWRVPLASPAVRPLARPLARPLGRSAARPPGMSRGASPDASRGASPGTSLCGTAQRMSKPPMGKPVFGTRKMGLAWARGTAHRSTTRPLARYLTIDTSSIAIARRPIRCLENVAMPRISKFLSGFVGRSCFLQRVVASGARTNCSRKGHRPRVLF